jgi:hypothetical protein
MIHGEDGPGVRGFEGTLGTWLGSRASSSVNFLNFGSYQVLKNAPVEESRDNRNVVKILIILVLLTYL